MEPGWRVRLSAKGIAARPRPRRVIARKGTIVVDDGELVCVKWDGRKELETLARDFVEIA